MYRSNKSNMRAKRAKSSRSFAPRRAQTSSLIIPASSHINTKLPTSVICRVPPRVQLLPDELRCFGKTQMQISGLAVSGVTNTWKLNGPFNLFGPQVNSAGAFGTNVPAGSAYLLSSNAAAGASAAYGKCTVLSARVDVELIGINSNSLPINIAMFCNTNPTVSGLAISLWREQKGAAYSELSYNATQALKLSTSVDVASIFGVNKDTVRQSPDFSQAPGVDPANLCYFHMYVATMDGSTVQTWYANVTVTHELVFRGLNTFNSVAPS